MTRRWWTLLVVALVALAGWAQGQTELEDDGVQEGPGAAVCVTRALEELFLSQHDAILLCQGADSDAPVDCYIRASQETFLDKTDLLSLCSPALSGDVVDPL